MAVLFAERICQKRLFNTEIHFAQILVVENTTEQNWNRSRENTLFTMGNRWQDKSSNSDVFFCTDPSCNVLTFRPGPSGRNVCPKCWTLGALCRSARLLTLTIADKANRDQYRIKQDESEETN
jgi:hypothetical protein